MSSQDWFAETAGGSRKRKDPEPSESDSRRAALGESRAEPVKPTASAPPAPAKFSNRLLAGLLAHEFLQKGTLSGKRWEARQPGPVAISAAQPNGSGDAAPGSYAEASYLLLHGGAHISGVVNPTQLARWLQK